MKTPFFIFLSFLILSLFPFVSKGQTGYEDAIYLKNGSILYGKIIENVPDKYVTVKTDDCNVYTNYWNQVYKVTKAQIGVHKKSDTVFYAKNVRRSGFINFTELNYGFDLIVPANNYTAYGIQTINGYLFNPGISIGAGIGYAHNNGDGSSFLPIFLDLRYYFLKSPNSIILVLDVGESPDIIPGTKYIGEQMINGSLDKKVHLSQKISIVCGIGFTYQYYSYIDSPNGHVTGEVINSIKLNLGMAID